MVVDFVTFDNISYLFPQTKEAIWEPEIKISRQN